MRHFYTCRVTKLVLDYVGAIRKVTVGYDIDIVPKWRKHDNFTTVYNCPTSESYVVYLHLPVSKLALIA